VSPSLSKFPLRDGNLIVRPENLRGLDRALLHEAGFWAEIAPDSNPSADGAKCPSHSSVFIIHQLEASHREAARDGMLAMSPVSVNDFQVGPFLQTQRINLFQVIVRSPVAMTFGDWPVTVGGTLSVPRALLEQQRSAAHMRGAGTSLRFVIIQSSRSFGGCLQRGWKPDVRLFSLK